MLFSEMGKRELSEIPPEEYDKIVRLAAMEDGVPEPDPLPDFEVPLDPVEGVEKVTCYKIGSTSLVFRSMEQAEAFLDLGPLMHRTEFIGSGYNKSLEFIPEPGVDTPQIIPVKLLTHDVFSSIKGLATEHRQILDAREKLVSDHEETRSEWSTLRESVVTRIGDAKRESFEAAKIRELFDRYVADCKGDRQIALTFLRKLHSDTDIRAAWEWSDEVSPIPEENPPTGEGQAPEDGEFPEDEEFDAGEVESPENAALDAAQPGL